LAGTEPSLLNKPSALVNVPVPLRQRSSSLRSCIAQLSYSCCLVQPHSRCTGPANDGRSESRAHPPLRRQHRPRRCADPAYDDSNWEHITTDKTWGAQTRPSYTGFAWYRRHLDIPLSALPNEKLAILMPPVEDAYELSWNGVRIGHQGNPPPQANWYLERRQSFALPVISTGVRDRVLAIRIWKAQLNATDSASLGGLRAPPVLGEASSIGQLVGLGDFLFLRRGLYRQAIHVIFLIAGIVALLCGLTIAYDGSFLVLRMVPALRSHVCSYPLIDPPKIWDMNDLRGPPFDFWSSVCN
jgi:hypothetical protein